MPNQTQDGEKLPGTDVYLIDVLAYVAGVNYGSVVKVLSALSAVAELENMPLPDYLSLDCVPSQSVVPHAPEFTDRSYATTEFVASLLASGIADKYPALLKATRKIVGRAEAFKPGLTD